MESALVIKIFLLAVLIAVSGFFSGSESALFSLGLSRVRRLKKSAKKSFDAAQALLASPTKLISTLLIGNEVINAAIGVVGATIAYDIFHNHLEQRHLKWAAIGVILPFLLMLGELIPKTIGLKMAERWVGFCAVPLYWFSQATAPIRNLLVWVPDQLLKLTGGAKRPLSSLSEEMFRSMVDAGREEGVLDAQEQKLIHNVFTLDDVRVDSIMTPVGAVSTLWDDVTIREAMPLLQADRFSRFPILSRNSGEVVGVLYAKDLLADKELRPEEPTSHLARPALIVSPETNALELFSQFRSRRTHFAVVALPGQPMQGVVTLDDVLEEIFGRIRDERDLEEGLPFKSSS